MQGLLNQQAGAPAMRLPSLQQMPGLLGGMQQFAQYIPQVEQGGVTNWLAPPQGEQSAATNWPHPGMSPAQPNGVMNWGGGGHFGRPPMPQQWREQNAGMRWPGFGRNDANQWSNGERNNSWGGFEWGY